MTKQYKGITEFQLFLFNEGTNYYSYKMMGAHPYTQRKKQGFRFSVWAPNAKSVSVVGDFNNWDENKNPLDKIEAFGVWVGFIPEINEGAVYKYCIVTPKGEKRYKADPYAFSAQIRPDTASVVYRPEGYAWGDSAWMEERNTADLYQKPINIYELHLGSWAREEDGGYLNYRQIADKLVQYIKKMGYTHIELMPVAEHPYDGSWGYQVTGYYAPTSRFGSPHDFMCFVDTMHQNGIGVITDWVPAHFPKDEHGLIEFDGTSLYEYADKRIGEHIEWGTKSFNFKRSEVISFLVSNAVFWLDIYHIDGLRVDAVSSMLYLDYGRKDGEWIKNKHGGRENLEAAAFLKTLNTVVFQEFKNIIMAAEESTSWPLVTKPVPDGGLGFNYKWNMGWMNDILRYMSLDPYFRQFNHNLLTFSMVYAFSENYILPISHDEVVHGKKSLIDKMWGSYEEKFAQLRTFLGYMTAHPGKKLLFMGCELGEFLEWQYEKGLCFSILEYDMHKKLHRYVRELNVFYKDHPGLYEIDFGWDGFEWINPDDCGHNIVSFIRKDKSGGELIFIANFSPVEAKKYWVGVNALGEYEVLFSSDSKKYGGTGSLRRRTIKSKKSDCNGREQYISLNIPPFSCIYLKKSDQDYT